MAQLLDLMESSIPDVGATFLLKDESCSGTIGVTQLLEILTDAKIANAESLALVKKATARGGEVLHTTSRNVLLSK